MASPSCKSLSALILSLALSLSTCQLQQFNGGGFNGFYQYPYYQNGFFPSQQQQPLNTMSYTYPYGGNPNPMGPMMQPQQYQMNSPMGFNNGGGGMYPIYQQQQQPSFYNSRPGEINVDVKTPVGGPGPMTTIIEKPVPMPIRETEVIHEPVPVPEPQQPIIKHIEQYTWGRDGLGERFGITPILQGMELVDQPKQRSAIRFQHIPRPFYVQKPQHFEQYEYGKRK